MVTSSEVGQSISELAAEVVDLWENTTVGLQAVDRDGGVIEANRAQRRLSGWSLADTPDAGAVEGAHVPTLIGEGAWRDILDQLDGGRPVRNRLLAVTGAGGAPAEWTVDVGLAADGGLVWVTRPVLADAHPGGGPTSAALRWLESCEPLELQGWLGSVGDEQASARVSWVLDFLDRIPVAAHQVALTGALMRVNRAQVEMLGYEDASSVVGMSAKKLFPDQDDLDAMEKALFTEGGIVNYRTPVFVEGGSTKPVVVFTSVRTMDGEPKNTRCFVFDADVDAG